MSKIRVEKAINKVEELPDSRLRLENRKKASISRSVPKEIYKIDSSILKRKEWVPQKIIILGTGFFCCVV